jgi:hypothetical protein
MVIESQAYIELISFFTENLDLFEASDEACLDKTLREIIEEHMAIKMISFFTQHESLNEDARLDIVREVDAIVTDLEEFLSLKLEQKVTEQQQDFIVEYAGLIKNLFDSYYVEDKS